MAIQTNQQAIFFPRPTTFLSLQFVFTHVKQKTLHFRYYCQRKLAWERKPAWECKPAWERKPAWEQAADKYFPIHLPSQPCR